MICPTDQALAGQDAFVVVVDTSWSEDTRRYRSALAALNASVVYTHVPLPTAHAMEFIRRLSLLWQLDVFYYAHNDALFVKPGVMAAARHHTCEHHLANPRWGVLFFFFDIFCCFRVEALRHTGAWDPYVPSYKADWDYYNRLQCAGFTQSPFNHTVLRPYVEHVGSATLRSLNQFHSPEIEFGWHLFDDAGRYLYFWTKWGTELEPWKDPGAFKLPFDGRNPGVGEPGRGIPLSVLINYLWFGYSEVVVVAIVIPYSILILVAGYHARQCCQRQRARGIKQIN
jgi:hypothetical protein